VEVLWFFHNGIAQRYTNTAENQNLYNTKLFKKWLTPHTSSRISFNWDEKISFMTSSTSRDSTSAVSDALLWHACEMFHVCWTARNSSDESVKWFSFENNFFVAARDVTNISLTFVWFRLNQWQRATTTHYCAIDHITHVRDVSYQIKFTSIPVGSFSYFWRSFGLPRVTIRKNHFVPPQRLYRTIDSFANAVNPCAFIKWRRPIAK